MDDMSTGGHEANRNSVPLKGCTDMSVSKDFSFAKKMIMKKCVTAEIFWEFKIPPPKLFAIDRSLNITKSQCWFSGGDLLQTKDQAIIHWPYNEPATPTTKGSSPSPQ